MYPLADTRPATPIGNLGLGDKPAQSGEAVNQLVVAYNICFVKQWRRLQGFVEKVGRVGWGVAEIHDSGEYGAYPSVAIKPAVLFDLRECSQP